jgi:hypothetical protein
MDVSNNERKKDEQYVKLRKIIHDIRNMLQLTEENKTFIEGLMEKEKMEIILEYDKIVQVLVQSIYTNM